MGYNAPPSIFGGFVNITLSLQAKTPDELSRATIQAQVFWGMKLRFFDFTQTKQGWICWFEIPLSIWQEKNVKS